MVRNLRKTCASRDIPLIVDVPDRSTGSHRHQLISGESHIHRESTAGVHAVLRTWLGFGLMIKDAEVEGVRWPANSRRKCQGLYSACRQFGPLKQEGRIVKWQFRVDGRYL